MKAVSREIDGEVRIALLGDLHIGNKASRYQQLVKTLSDEYYFILLGDLLDVNLKDSFGDVYSNDSLERELEVLENFFKQYSNKILGMVSGNHEKRIKRRIGINLLKIYADKYSIPYDENILIIDLNYKIPNSGQGMRRRFNAVFCIAHGYTFSRTIGGKINGNAQLLQVVSNADVYITGHTHTPSWFKSGIHEYDRRNKKIILRSRHFITVPAWLGYDDFAESRLMSPSGVSFVEIILTGRQKEKIIEVRAR